jgi:hypothetical protein
MMEDVIFRDKTQKLRALCVYYVTNNRVMTVWGMGRVKDRAQTYPGLCTVLQKQKFIMCTKNMHSFVRYNDIKMYYINVDIMRR